MRGVPRLAPVLKRLRSLDNYDDAVLFRQEVANLFAGFIKRPSPEMGQQPRDPVTRQLLTTDRDGFTPMVALEPGTMQELGPGEEVEFSKPPDAGNNYPDFMRQQLMAAAAGSSTPYEILTGDMREVNDRALRVVLNEFRRRLEQLQFGVYVHQLCRPVRAAWMDMGERCTGRVDALAVLATRQYVDEAVSGLAVLILVAMAASFGTAWQVQDWRLGRVVAEQGAQFETDLAAISNAAAAQARAEQNKRQALE